MFSVFHIVSCFPNICMFIDSMIGLCEHDHAIVFRQMGSDRLYTSGLHDRSSPSFRRIISYRCIHIASPILLTRHSPFTYVPGCRYSPVHPYTDIHIVRDMTDVYRSPSRSYRTITTHSDASVDPFGRGKMSINRGKDNEYWSTWGLPGSSSG